MKLRLTLDFFGWRCDVSNFFRSTSTWKCSFDFLTASDFIRLHISIFIAILQHGVREKWQRAKYLENVQIRVFRLFYNANIPKRIFSSFWRVLLMSKGGPFRPYIQSTLWVHFVNDFWHSLRHNELAEKCDSHAFRFERSARRSRLRTCLNWFFFGAVNFKHLFSGWVTLTWNFAHISANRRHFI